MAISMLKIRRPLGRLIFNMGIAIPGKTVFLIETAPWTFEVRPHLQNKEIYWLFIVETYILPPPLSKQRWAESASAKW